MLVELTVGDFLHEQSRKFGGFRITIYNLYLTSFKISIIDANI